MSTFTRASGGGIQWVYVDDGWDEEMFICDDFLEELGEGAVDVYEDHVDIFCANGFARYKLGDIGIEQNGQPGYFCSLVQSTFNPPPAHILRST